MIYLYALLVNSESYYIGLTRKLTKRRSEHRRTKPPHVFQVIDTFQSTEEAVEKERLLIEQHDTFKRFDKWNKSPGGDYLENSGYDRKGIGGAKKGHIPWNKGLTVDDPRVKANGQKTRETRLSKDLYKPWNKGKKCPGSGDNGRKGAAKQSAHVTGRKLATREDGTRYWVYPSSQNIT